MGPKVQCRIHILVDIEIMKILLSVYWMNECSLEQRIWNRTYWTNQRGPWKLWRMSGSEILSGVLLNRSLYSLIWKDIWSVNVLFLSAHKLIDWPYQYPPPICLPAWQPAHPPCLTLSLLLVHSSLILVCMPIYQFYRFPFLADQYCASFKFYLETSPSWKYVIISNIYCF